MIEKIKRLEEIFWINNKKEDYKEGEISLKEIKDAYNRFLRFKEYIKLEFNQTEKYDGLIESDIVEVNKFKKALGDHRGRLFVKKDNELAVCGSVKARGGIYEVLKIAETILIEKGILKEDYKIFRKKEVKDILNTYTLSVGSTGNLGLSIGIMGRHLGFKVQVHMSSDAKKWKKDLLRQKGVQVIEYDEDYSFAVKNARENALKDDSIFFIDDENSKDLFLGYSVSAFSLYEEFLKKGIDLFKVRSFNVYLPCGVGGAPGGIMYGIKSIFKDKAKCYYCEPVKAPCMLVGFYTSKHHLINTKDIIKDSLTEADGLAVTKPSGFVGRVTEKITEGFSTCKDKEMFRYLKLLYEKENIKIEPSAAVGFKAFEKNPIKHDDDINLVWLTGGSMVPDEIFKEMLKR